MTIDVEMRLNVRRPPDLTEDEVAQEKEAPELCVVLIECGGLFRCVSFLTRAEPNRITTDFGQQLGVLVFCHRKAATW